MAGLFRPPPSCGLWPIYLLRGMRRFRPAYARLDTGGFPRHGRQCIPIRHTDRGSPPSLLCWIFLAANWLQETGLNRRYTAYEAAALPLHHPAMCRGLTVPRRYKIGDMPRLGLERIAGIEPTCSARKADVLPLNYTRVCPPPKGRVKGDICRRSFPAVR